MKIILHSDAMEKRSIKLEKLIHEQLPGIEIKVSIEIEGLKKDLCKPLNGISVAVLMVSSIKNLEQLLELKAFFDNTKLILILSEKIKAAQTTGFQLNPCFISYLDSDLNDTLLVIKKIKERIYDLETQHT